MGGSGLDLRMRRVFPRSGRSVIVAVDHLVVLTTPEPGLADIPALVRGVRSGGADAVLATQGVLREAVPHLGGMAVILSAVLADDSYRHVPELALCLGADMVKILAYPFTPGFTAAAGHIAALAAACDRWGLPLMVETVPGGFDADQNLRAAGPIVAGARIAVELGASAVKTLVPEDSGGGTDEAGLNALARYLPVPVVVLGGGQVDPSAFGERIAAVAASDVAGVAVGRNVWTQPDPASAVGALCRAVHGLDDEMRRDGNADR